MLDISSLKHVHVVGVGGIGLSALARLMKLEGIRVTGSDRSESRVTEGLREIGVEIKIGNWPEVIEGADLLVHSKSVPQEDIDRARARELGIKELTYADLLGVVSKGKKTIAVTGTHGKTTTTAMLAAIAKHAGLDPSAVVGSLVPDFGSNLLKGEGEHFIAEACEYKRSFLTLDPYILVITNIDMDHLDYFKDMADIQSAFCELSDQIVDGGVLVYDPNDENQIPVVEHLKKTNKERNISLVPIKQRKVDLKLMGDFNQMNASTALAVSGVLGIDESKALEALSNFSGTWRRQEFKGKTASGISVYDDYGHNPVEIMANLKAMRENFADQKIVTIFQPHLYSRTEQFFDDFTHSFSDSNVVVVLPIYEARKEALGSITHKTLVQALEEAGTEAHTADSFDEARRLVEKLLPSGGVAITQGAGEAFVVGDLLLA